jgi:hypothetical protein
MEIALRVFNRAELCKDLMALGVAAGPVNTVPEAFESMAAVPPLDPNIIGKLPVPTAIISPVIVCVALDSNVLVEPGKKTRS